MNKPGSKNKSDNSPTFSVRIKPIFRKEKEEYDKKIIQVAKRLQFCEWCFFEDGTIDNVINIPIGFCGGWAYVTGKTGYTLRDSEREYIPVLKIKLSVDAQEDSLMNLWDMVWGNQEDTGKQCPTIEVSGIGCFEIRLSKPNRFGQITYELYKKDSLS